MTDELNQQFGLHGLLRFEGGGRRLISAAAGGDLASAQIYLHGAQLTQFQPRGEAPALYLSPNSRLEPGAAIRGGVPVIFPWFGSHPQNPAAPAHGFARTMNWRMESADHRADGSIRLVLTLAGTPETRSAWPHDFELRYLITIGSILDLTLEVRNRDAEPFTFQEALHTYLAVEDVRKITVAGLAGCDYLDKVDGMKRKTQVADPISLTGETDRVYLNTAATCVIHDPVAGRRILVQKTGSNSTVMWNPWSAKSAAMADLGADQWIRMLCVETANVGGNAITLQPDSIHRMGVNLRVEPA